jgi:hemoglobin
MTTPQADPVADLFASVGEPTIRATVRAFYARVPDDDVLGPMYPKDDLAGAEERLGDFLVMRFGGPQRYMERRGHPRLRMRHAPFAVDVRARDRWVTSMDRALDAEWPDPATRERARAFLHDVATFLVNTSA